MNKLLFLIIVTSLSFFSHKLTAQSELTNLSEPYLGQKAPTKIPEIFAPGIICLEDKSSGCCAFNKEGTMMLFKRFLSREENYIYITELKDGKWTEPKIAPFESDYYDGDFTFNPQGDKLYISSRRPINDNKEEVKSNIWIVDFIDGKWGEPYIMNGVINTDKHESYPYVAENGNFYYFARDRGGYGMSDMFISKPVNGEYKEIVNLGETINTEWHEWDPCIAPDESYLIFCSTKPDGYGSDDLYISFKDSSGEWGEPKNMGETINSSGSENRPIITLDGKYFFFTSTKTGKRRDIYWVDAS